MQNLASVFLGVVFGILPGIYIGVTIAIREYKLNSDWWKENSKK